MRSTLRRTLCWQTRDTREALAAFRRHGGVMSTSEALAAGVHPAALYGLLQEGRLERLARGLYRSAGAREFSNPDLAVVARKAPDVAYTWRFLEGATRAYACAHRR